MNSREKLAAKATERLWLVAAVAVVFTLVNAQWIWLHRRAQPWDIDEAGYLSIALANAHAAAHGPWAWLQSVEAPSIQAPLTTSLASLVFLVVGSHPVAGLAVPLAAGLVTIVAAFMLARSAGSFHTGLASAALVASCPLLVNYARSFSFALPATAVMTVALLAIIRSRGFRLRGWALVFGVALGLLPLARTMTIAFLPGLLVAAGWSALIDGRDVGRRLVLLLGAVALAIVVAASWLVFNGALVFGYLFSFGYGARVGEFAAGGSMNFLTSSLYTLRDLANKIYAPHAVVVVLAVLASPILIFARVRRSGVRPAFLAALRSPLLPVFLVIVEALAALSSSSNKGSAFDLPIVPALIVLSVCIIDRVSDLLQLRAVGAVRNVIYGAACLIPVITLISLAPGLARPLVLSIPGFGPITVSDGRGTIQLYEANAGFRDGVSKPLSTAHGTAWIGAADELASILDGKPAGFGFRHYILNVNSVRLQDAVGGSDGPALVQVEPFVTGDTVSGYRKWLTQDEARATCRLVTISGEQGQFLPAVTSGVMAEAAQGAGFVPERALPTPDGQTLTIWRRTTGSSPAC